MRFLLALFFVSLVQILFAQDWAPINSTEQFNYSLNNSDVITHAIKVDSVQVNGQDSVMYFNQVMRQCDTCCVDLFYDESAQGSFLLNHQPNFFGYKAQINSDEWKLIFNEDSISIRPYAQLNDSWNYSTGITATVSVVIEAEILGELDSVKVITLSNNEEIRLSKSHGLIEFTSSNADIYLLSGIEGRDLGKVAPSFGEFFNFDIGDLFQFSLRTEAFFSDDGFSVVYDIYGVEQRIVTNVEEFPDSLVLSYDFIRNDTTFNHVENSYEYNIDTGSAQEVYKLENFETLSKQPGTPSTHISHFLGSYMSNLTNQSFAVSESDRRIMYFGGYKFLNESSNTDYLSEISNITFYCYDDKGFDYENTIAKGDGDFFSFLASMNVSNNSVASGYNCALVKELGYVSRNKFVQQYEGTRYQGEHLIGFIKENGDTEGTILSESELLSMNEYERIAHINLFPNPTTNQLTVTSDSRIKEITIYNSLGRIEKSEKISGLNHTFYLDNFSSGIYFIELEFDDGQTAKKRILKH